jgi:hypothetical protein
MLSEESHVKAPVSIDWSAAKPKGLDEVLEWEWDMVITLCDTLSPDAIHPSL